MITAQMREEFERTNSRDHRRQPPKGNNYIDPMAQMDWESFQKGWLQSRATLVIDLPEPYEAYDGSIAADDGIGEQVMDANAVCKSLTDARVSYK